MGMGWRGRVIWGGEDQGVEGRSKGAVVEGSALLGQQQQARALRFIRWLGPWLRHEIWGIIGHSVETPLANFRPQHACFSINCHSRSHQKPHQSIQDRFNQRRLQSDFVHMHSDIAVRKGSRAAHHHVIERPPCLQNQRKLGTLMGHDTFFSPTHRSCQSLYFHHAIMRMRPKSIQLLIT